MTHSRLLALAALCLAAGCSSDSKPPSDSTAVTTAAANGAVLGDTALARTGATSTTATAITPAPPSGRPVPSAMPAAPNAGAPAGVAAGAPATGTVVTGTDTALATTAGAPASAPAAQQQALTTTAPPAPQRAPIPYSAGERLAYDVKFGSIDVGDAVMEVLGLENVRGRQALHIRFNVKGGTFLYKVNDRYESWIDTVNLVSLRHWQEIDEGSYERERKYEIMPEIGVYKENE